MGSPRYVVVLVWRGRIPVVFGAYKTLTGALGVKRKMEKEFAREVASGELTVYAPTLRRPTLTAARGDLD